jgi:hypothetical protein
VLGDEDGVAAVGRLLAVLVRLGRCDALADDLPRVLPEPGRAVELGQAPVAAAQVELPAERLPGEALQPGVDRVRAKTVAPQVLVAGPASPNFVDGIRGGRYF